jgi:hypothetical protein
MERRIENGVEMDNNKRIFGVWRGELAEKGIETRKIGVLSRKD